MSLLDELAAGQVSVEPASDVRVDPMGSAAKLAIVSAARSLPATPLSPVLSDQVGP